MWKSCENPVVIFVIFIMNIHELRLLIPMLTLGICWEYHWLHKHPKHLKSTKKRPRIFVWNHQWKPKMDSWRWGFCCVVATVFLGKWSPALAKWESEAPSAWKAVQLRKLRSGNFHRTTLRVTPHFLSLHPLSFQMGTWRSGRKSFLEKAKTVLEISYHFDSFWIFVCKWHMLQTRWTHLAFVGPRICGWNPYATILSPGRLRWVWSSPFLPNGSGDTPASCRLNNNGSEGIFGSNMQLCFQQMWFCIPKNGMMSIDTNLF